MCSSSAEESHAEENTVEMDEISSGKLYHIFPKLNWNHIVHNIPSGCLLTL